MTAEVEPKLDFDFFFFLNQGLWSGAVTSQVFSLCLCVTVWTNIKNTVSTACDVCW